MDSFYETWHDDLVENITMTDASDLVEQTFGFNPGWHSDTAFSLKDLVEKAFHLEYFHIYRMLWR